MYFSINCRWCVEILLKPILCRYRKRWIQDAEHLKFSIFIFSASWSVFVCKIGPVIGKFNSFCCLNHISTAFLSSLCCAVWSRFAWSGMVWNLFFNISRIFHIVHTVDEEVPNSFAITFFLSLFSNCPIIAIFASNLNWRRDMINVFKQLTVPYIL